MSRYETGRTQAWWLLVALLTASLCMNFLDRTLALASQDLPEAVVRLVELTATLSNPLLLLTVLGVGAALSYPIQFLSGRQKWLNALKRWASPIRWLFVSASLATLLSLALKFALGRLRPGYSADLDHMVFKPFVSEEGFASMPSTHCAIAGAVTIGLSAFCPSLRTPMLQLGLVVCLSRTLLGEHWASDTVVGWTLGAAVVLILLRKVAPRPTTATSPG